MMKARTNLALRKLSRPYWGVIALLCLLNLVQSVLQVGLSLIMRYVIDSAINANGRLLFWGIILGADIVLMILLYALTAWLSGSATDKFSAALRARLLRAAVYCNDVRLQGFHSGQLLSRGMEDVHSVCDGVITVLPTLVGQVTRLVGAFCAVLLIAPNIAWVLAAAGFLAVLAVAAIRPALKARHRAVRKADETVMGVMQEDLQHLELIQSLDAQSEILTRFDARQKESLLQKCRRRVLSVGISTAMNVAALVGTGALLLWGAAQVAAGQLSFGSLTSMLQLLSLFRGPVLTLSGLWARLAAIDVAAERLTDLLRTPEPTVPAEVSRVKAVVLENVTFAYPGDEAPVLKNFSVRFPLDGWACLTGLSGKGKSTIFKLILGLYAPQEGRVCLETEDGMVPCGENTRHLFAYVPQDFALFSGTVRENLDLISQADSQKQADALHTAQADFVWDLSAGLDTQVGENNTGLSKGQLQRLAIARAILMERRILLLDECTSALDARTEADVLKGLHEMGKQAILVTHRPDALEQLPSITGVSLEN